MTMNAKTNLLGILVLCVSSAMFVVSVGCSQAPPEPPEPPETIHKPRVTSVEEQSIFETAERANTTIESVVRAYLVGTVAPCTTRFEGTDPCMHPILEDEKSHEGSAGTIDPIDPLDFDDVAAYDLTNIGRVSTAHMVVRGALLPGTIRCGAYPYHPPFSEDSYTWLSPIVDCFVDFHVHDYIVGRGPGKLTLSVGGMLPLYGFTNDTFPSKIELDELVKESQAEQIARIEEVLIGREFVVGINPNGNIAQLVWRSTSNFTVERADDGAVRVVSIWLRFMREDGAEITDEHRDHLSWPLDEFERRAVAFHKNRPEMSGVGWDHLPATILTDAYDIHRYFDEELRPIYEPHGIVPAKPEPAPGEPHAHPALTAIPLESTEADPEPNLSPATGN